MQNSTQVKQAQSPQSGGDECVSLHVRREARPGWQPVDLRELWHYRELLFFYALREIKVRYKQTALGATWAILQPVMTMVVFTIFFGKLAKIPSDGQPYAVTTFCALLPWQLFAFALTQSSNSLVDNAHVLTKVYFPRLVMPLASTIAGLVDFLIAFGVFILLMLFYHFQSDWQMQVGWQVVLLPLFIALAVLAALSIGLWLSALNLQYRDVRYTVPFLTQLWLFVTPVAYQSSLVPEQWRLLYALNPMAGVVDGFRWALLGQTPPGPMLVVSVLATVALFVGGLFFFRRMEKTFADIA